MDEQILMRISATYRSRLKGGFLLVGIAVAIPGFFGCSTTHYQEQADAEVYGLLDEKMPEVPGVVPDFDIAKVDSTDLSHLPVNELEAVYLGGESAGELGASVVTLEEALALAFTHSREYKNARDSLYLEALGLTLDRHQYSPIFSGMLSGDYARSTTDVVTPNALGEFLASAPGVAADIESLTGAPANLFREYSDLVAAAAAVTGANTTELEIMNERSIDGQTRFGVDVLMKGGGRLALNLTSNFLKFLTGDSRESAASALIGTFTQPLLRGRGREVSAERLTQAERDLLYQMRSFTRFRKTFSVSITAQYYSVLGNRDAVQNGFRGYESAQGDYLRLQALYDEGRVPKGDVGRSQRDLLRQESSWISAIRRYKNTLDDFKVVLGLPADSTVILDEQELVTLAQRGLINPDMTSEEAVKIALAARLDLYTQRDRVGDASRKVVVAADSLKPGLALILTGRVDSKDGNRPFSLDFDRAEWSAGFDLDLPFDRKAERNAFRSSLIAYERSERNLSLFEDSIKLDVREALRVLEQNNRDYEISRQSVALDTDRNDEQELLLELGQGRAIDKVQANNDLIQSQNQLTNALVTHTIARLRFYQDIGILFIKENGQWEEIS